MTYFLKHGSTYSVTSKKALDLHESLPGGNYTIGQDMQGNLFLSTIDDFTFKGKQYGDLSRNRDRIMSTFLDRPSATGVMLAGEKGSGKSLLARSICMKAAESNIPTIVINAPYAGDKFNSFLQSIEQPTIVLFDEFEKVYDKDDQEKILTLLDGVFPSKKLFILTCNDKWRIDSNMRNRPGRIFYMMDFHGLTAEFIEEYCNDNLKNKTHVVRVVTIGTLFSEFNFDMLKALVEEMNRYNESPEEALLILNAKPEFDANKVSYSMEILCKGLPLPEGKSTCGNPTINPLLNNFAVSYCIREADPKDEDDEGEDYHQVFTPGDLKKIDGAAGKFVYFKDDHTVTLTRIIEKRFSYYDALAS